MSHTACVFPSCTARAMDAGASDGPFCDRCSRPLGGASIGLTGAYRVVGFLGTGYYADVFLVVEGTTGTSYAAKAYQRGLQKRNAAAREVEALQRLSHLRLPVFKETFDVGNWLFTVMGLVAGPNVRDEVAVHGPLDVRQAVVLGIDVCEVFAYIASEGWTYRDLHPKNVHRDTPRGAMLVDLDGARPPHSPARPSGRAGYRAPELERQGPVTPACDIFSLAGCLYFALTGEDPPEEPGPLTDLRAILAAYLPLADLMDQCRQDDPALRPRAHDMRLALERVRTGIRGPNGA